ncbi:MAG: TlpA family protein disulfide reductase [Bacteroidia bacterium]|jgi:thiol-disulfide isomerase/thioredoxin
MKFAVTVFYILGFLGLGYGQHVNSIKLVDLEKRITNDTDTLYIVNFWATWCVPCVKELPAFDSIQAAYADKNVKVLLVSLDFKEDLESKLLPFIANKKVKSEVVLLDETDANYFIPRISKEWSGAIPATLLQNNRKKTTAFFEKKLNYAFLKTEIEKIQ